MEYSISKCVNQTNMNRKMILIYSKNLNLKQNTRISSSINCRGFYLWLPVSIKLQISLTLPQLLRYLIFCAGKAAAAYLGFPLCSCVCVCRVCVCVCLPHRCLFSNCSRRWLNDACSLQQTLEDWEGVSEAAIASRSAWRRRRHGNPRCSCLCARVCASVCVWVFLLWLLYRYFCCVVLWFKVNFVFECRICAPVKGGDHTAIDERVGKMAAIQRNRVRLLARFAKVEWNTASNKQ